MRNAISEFQKELDQNGGVVRGIRYKKDNDIETQVRLDYLKDEFGESATEEELAKYRDSEGNINCDINDGNVWASIISNLSSKNI